MRGTETTSAAELAAMARSVGGEIGVGAFNQITEVKGTLRCQQPLTSELSRIPCAYYTMKVTREYEEISWRTDANGKRESQTRRGSEVVAENSRLCRFEVEDATGRVAVDATGAKFELEKACDRFEPGDPGGASLKMGRWQLDLGLLVLGPGRRTVGYRYEEWLLPVDRPIFVLGEASDAQGELVIRKPGAKGTSFLVSTRSEESLIQSADKAARWLVVGTTVSGVAGLVMMILYLVR